MTAALPGTMTSTTRAKLAASLLGASLAAAACAPASSPPNIPVAQGGTFQVQVVDAAQDVGRAPSVAIDPKGTVAITYLLVTPAPTPGVLPQPPTPGVPQPPSVVLATGNPATAIWNHTAVSGQNAVGLAQGLAPQIANSKGFATAGVDTSLAIDAAGKHHVIWSTPSGLFYSDDTLGTSFSKPVRIVQGQTFGASIAVAPAGTAWVSFVQGFTVKVATKSGTSWKVEAAGRTTGAPGLPADVTAIRVGSGGQPITAFGDNGRTMIAMNSGGAWNVVPVSGPGGLAVSMDLDKSGNPRVAYYDAHGGVHLATSARGANWQVTDLGSTAAGQGQGGDPKWSTGVVVDDKGIDYVTWADTRANDVVLATNGSGKFTSQPLPASQSGANPSIGVSPDGKTLVVAWFDSVNLNLDLASSPVSGLALAHPTPTLQQPSIPPPTAACKPSGATLSVTAKGIAFNTNCLAAPSNTAFTINFTNDDAGVPHNVEIFTDSTATARLGGATGAADTVTGPGSTTYKVDALKPGTYFFRCDVHPTQMTGTFVVAK
jgi:plastocyanin